RTIITNTLGGLVASPADRTFHWRRLARAAWRIGVGQFKGIAKLLRAPAALARLDARIEAARGLAELYRGWVDGWVLITHTALAIGGVWATFLRARQLLRLPGKARLVTEEMMEEYGGLALLPQEQRETGLDAWLARHGHRGPGESDVAR